MDLTNLLWFIIACFDSHEEGCPQMMRDCINDLVHALCVRGHLEQEPDGARHIWEAANCHRIFAYDGRFACFDHLFVILPSGSGEQRCWFPSGTETIQLGQRLQVVRSVDLVRGVGERPPILVPFSCLVQAISQRGSTADSMRDIFRALSNGEKAVPRTTWMSSFECHLLYHIYIYINILCYS